MGQITVGNTTAFFDDADFLLVNSHQWHVHKSIHTNYLRGFSKDRPRRLQSLVYMHRLIMRAPKGLGIDHINGNGADNRRDNLRFCTQSQNNANRHVPQTKTSPTKGVHLEGQTGRWRAEIQRDGKRYKLGRYKTHEEAAAAYLAKAKELFGEFATAGHVRI